MNKHNGFTIVEVITIIVILAILATVATIGLTRILDDGGDSKRAANASAIAAAIDKYYEEKGEYPTCAQITADSESISATLKNIDRSILVAPDDNPNDGNSITCDDEPSTSNDVFYYECIGSGGYCANYELHYFEKASGDILKVSSNRGGGPG